MRRSLCFGYLLVLALFTCGYAQQTVNPQVTAALSAGYERRHPWVPWIGVWNTFAPLRDDPRLHDLLRRMNLTAGAFLTAEPRQ